MLSSKELMSFCLMNYNQKAYIGEALSAAFAQTYSPLEIIISDDGSTDGSYELMEQMIADYHGPHKVILHRNERNCGIIRNWENLCRLSHGTLLFKADGDDISLPERVATVVADWEASGKKAILISHSMTKIDVTGKQIGSISLPGPGWDTRTKKDILCGKGWFHQGAAGAYHRSLFEKFPSAVCPEAADDTVYTGRAVLSGPIRSLSEPLVLYRIGSGATSVGKAYRKSMVRGLKFGAESQKQLLLDLEAVKDTLSREDYESFRKLFAERQRHHETVLKLYEGRTFRERREGLRESGCGRFLSTAWIVSMCLLLPPLAGDFLLNGLLRIQKLLKK